MSDRSIGLAIDGYQCSKAGVEIEVPEESPVSLILFAIYMSGVFREIEKEVEGCTPTSFEDDCR